MVCADDGRYKTGVRWEGHPQLTLSLAMTSPAQFLYAFTTSVLLIGAVTAAPAEGAEHDWKYAIGWDGITLPASAIGAPLKNGTTQAIEVCRRLDPS